jgi:hypothetical protein
MSTIDEYVSSDYLRSHFGLHARVVNNWATTSPGVASASLAGRNNDDGAGARVRMMKKEERGKGQGQEEKK